MENGFNLSFNKLIDERLQGLDFSLKETEAYVKSTFIKYIKSNNILPNKSVTLSYIEAKEEYNFNKFQELADWLFFLQSTYPEHLNSASPEYYNAIAQLSYYKCYNILNKKWILFEELADNFVHITNYIYNNQKLL